MALNSVLSERDAQILDTLIHRVRVLTVPQIARTWWAETTTPVRNARKRLRELERQGALTLFQALIHRELPMESPVVAWQPGMPPPPFGEISYRLRSRWTESPKQVPCVVATKLAAEHFGGAGGRLPRETEQTHDVHHAAVFLQFRRRFPELVNRWISEATILRSHAGESEKLPDAIVESETGILVIEFGGAYSKEKIEDFHNYCRDKSFPYELW